MTPEASTERRVTVRGIIIQDDRLLAVKHKPYQGVEKATTHTWCLPGGGLNPAEDLTVGLKRELYEELGITVEVGKLLYIQQFIHRNVEVLELFFHVVGKIDIEKIALSQTSHGNEEIADISLINFSEDALLPSFLNIEDITAHISENRPVKIFSDLS